MEGSPLLLLRSDFVKASLDQSFELLLVEFDVLAQLELLFDLPFDH